MRDHSQTKLATQLMGNFHRFMQWLRQKQKTNSVTLSPRANYTD
jgi:hypothetical protein